MGVSVKIRESVPHDKELIKEVHQNAFGESDGEAISQLATDLLEDETAMPVLSLDYPEAWMAQELVDGSLAKIDGVIRCAASLSSPEYW